MSFFHTFFAFTFWSLGLQDGLAGRPGLQGPPAPFNTPRRRFPAAGVSQVDGYLGPLEQFSLPRYLFDGFSYFSIFVSYFIEYVILVSILNVSFFNAFDVKLHINYIWFQWCPRGFYGTRSHWPQSILRSMESSTPEQREHRSIGSWPPTPRPLHRRVPLKRWRVLRCWGVEVLRCWC